MVHEAGTAAQKVSAHCEAALNHTIAVQDVLEVTSANAGELRTRVVERRLWEVRERLLGVDGWSAELRKDGLEGPGVEL